jgi:hypothetical protein
MATIEYLQEKVAKAEEKVNKCKGTVERHKKQLEKKIKTGDVWDIKWKEDDIKGAEKKLVEAERILGNWQEKLDAEINIEKAIENDVPQVIKDFLEQWKQMAYEWHVKKYDDYQVFKKDINEKAKQAERELGVLEGRMPSKYQREQLEEMRLDWKSVQERKVNFAGHTVLEMCKFREEDDRLAYLNKELEREKKAKLLELVARIKGVVGVITDATGLYIKAGQINGYVIGDKGKAEVRTIGAGGWNIQCFHYRTLIKPF